MIARLPLYLTLMVMASIAIASCSEKSRQKRAIHTPRAGAAMEALLPPPEQIATVGATTDELTSDEELQLTPDEWQSILSILAKSKPVDFSTDMMFRGRIKITSKDGRVVEVWLLDANNRTYYTVSTSGNPQSKFVSTLEDPGILKVLSAIQGRSQNRQLQR